LRRAALFIGCLLIGMSIARFSRRGPSSPRAESLPRAPLVVAAVERAVPAPPPAARTTYSAAAQAAEVADALAALNALPEPARDARSGKERKPRSQPEQRAPRAPRALTHSGKPGTALAALAKDCDPPYSIDAQGIKRFHRECLASKP